MSWHLFTYTISSVIIDNLRDGSMGGTVISTVDVGIKCYILSYEIPLFLSLLVLFWFQKYTTVFSEQNKFIS